MYGQMTAGSWIYIGTQGIVQGTYETFAEVGRKHYGGNLKGKWFLTAGLGGMGGAQPLAATMAGASMVAIECQPSRIDMRLRTRYLDTQAKSVDEAIEMIKRSPKPISVGVLGNAAEILPDMVKRGIRPDAVTDQTSAHDPVNGYLPIGWTLAQWEDKRVSDPQAVKAAAMASMKIHVQAMLDFQKAGIPTLDYGNNIRQMAFEMGLKDAFDFPALCPPISARCSAAASAPSAGPPCPAIPKTFTRPISASRNSSPTTNTCTTGSTWPVNASPSRVSRPHLLGRPRPAPSPRAGFQ